MAKLGGQTTAGFNAGHNYYAKMVRISDIIIDPEISNIFAVSDKIKNDIVERIKKIEYDKSQPLVTQKGTNILLDGHTRLAAAREAGLDEVPVVEMEFEDRDSAILYTIERQIIRRNITGREILIAAKMIQGRKPSDGTGRAVDNLAKRINVSASTLYQARKVLKEAPPEDIEAIEKGEAAIKPVYNKLVESRKPEVEFHSNGSQSLPGNIAFLKGAVILLAQAGQVEAAELLINHYLRKNERQGFYKLLPVDIKEQIIPAREDENENDG